MLENAPLLVILILAIFTNNHTVEIAAIFLLLIKLFDRISWFFIFEKKCINIGIIILLISILAPIVEGKITALNIIETIFTPISVIAVITSIFFSWAARKGLLFANIFPNLLCPIVVGTVIGVSCLGGVVNSPIITGGLAWLIISIFKLKHK